MPGSCPKIFRHAMVWILEVEISADPGFAEAVCVTEGTLWHGAWMFPNRHLSRDSVESSQSAAFSSFNCDTRRAA